MNVQELINELLKIEDKTQKVTHDCDYSWFEVIKVEQIHATELDEAMILLS